MNTDGELSLEGMRAQVLAGAGSMRIEMFEWKGRLQRRGISVHQCSSVVEYKKPTSRGR
jgi:hypothetical protein